MPIASHSVSFGNPVQNGENVVLLFRQQQKRFFHLCQPLPRLLLLRHRVLPHNKALVFVWLVHIIISVLAFLKVLCIYLCCIKDLV